MKFCSKYSLKQRQIHLKIEQAIVLRNEQIAHGIWRMSLVAPDVASAYVGPGQFISLLTDDSWDHLVRRPMSIAKINEDEVDIIYKIFGDVTDHFTKKCPGDSMNILGPLGNVFTDYNSEFAEPILIGGGVGLAPILNLYDACEKAVMIIGARSADEHFLNHKPDNSVYLTTDDGTAGIEGNVLTALKNMNLSENTILFACGPEPMLIAIQNYADEYNIRAQLSVESYMGCGTGLCQGCVIKKRNIKAKAHSYHERYSLVCMDGPVYSADEVCFD